MWLSICVFHIKNKSADIIYMKLKKEEKHSTQTNARPQRTSFYFHLCEDFHGQNVLRSPLP